VRPGLMTLSAFLGFFRRVAAASIELFRTAGKRREITVIRAQNPLIFDIYPHGISGFPGTLMCRMQQGPRISP
jgi:hypothetical protein